MDSADPLIWIALFVLAAAVFVLEAFCTACENVQNSELEEEEGPKGNAAAKRSTRAFRSASMRMVPYSV